MATSKQIKRCESSRESDQTRVHYRSFHNIFLYITERCQLRCGHCYMGERLERGLMLTLEDATWIMRICRSLGAEYITLLGGEPTLHDGLASIVAKANDLGFKQVMIDTNGLRPDRILKIPPSQLYNVTVSLDGGSPETHEMVRGHGTFEKTKTAIKQFVDSGYRVRINCTVFKPTIPEAPLILELADRLGVKLVNFHAFSEEGLGIGKESWSLTPYEWIGFCESLERLKNNYSVSIWYPPTWTTSDQISKYVDQGFRGCLGCSLDRLSIFPDKRCYVCSVLFDRAVHFAIITPDGLSLNKTNNEFHMFTGAMSQVKDSWLSGCPAEKVLSENGRPQTTDRVISMCRCWKTQL